MIRSALCVTCVMLASPRANAQWNRYTVDDTSRGADGVRLLDVNADDRMDIVTGWEEGGRVRIYLHPGPNRVQQPWPRTTVGQVASPEDAVFADIDGDGAIDVLSCCEGRTRTVYIHWAPSTPTEYTNEAAWVTTPIACLQKKQSWMFAVPAQLDGKNGVDFVVGSKGANASIGWIRSPQNPRDVGAWTWHRIADAGWIMSLRMVDMNGDGQDDILASDRRGSNRGVWWFKHPGRRSLERPWSRHAVGGQTNEVMFLDLQHTKPTGFDIVCAQRGGPILRFRGQTSNWTSSRISLPKNCGTGKGTGIGDINGDGIRDIVFSCENAAGGKSGLRWLSADKTDPLRWTDHEIAGAAGIKFDRIELIDLDEDGDLDVLTCEERDNLGVIWYENPARHR